MCCNLGLSVSGRSMKHTFSGISSSASSGSGGAGRGRSSMWMGTCSRALSKSNSSSEIQSKKMNDQKLNRTEKHHTNEQATRQFNKL